MKSMNRRTFVCAVWLISLSALCLAEEPPPSLAQFDEDVASCRRLIRQACAIVQDMAKEKELDVDKQEKGLSLLAEARKKWAELQKTYAACPPAEYAADAQFKARWKDVAQAFESMEQALAAGDPRRAMLVCGFGCGLFVTMHEENGLNYALDKLFHLRRTARTAATLFRAHGLEAVRPYLPVLLRQRDEVLLAPLPWPANDPRNDEYLAGLRELSMALDELALASAANNADGMDHILNNLVRLINKPYGSAL